MPSQTTIKNNYFITVIVAIYHVESFLQTLVDNLLQCDLSDIEVMLIDDGSPDNCGKICDDYAAGYDQIIALHKENGGLSDARNYGIDRANGKWIIFFDGDDNINPKKFNEFTAYLRTLNNIDVVFNDYFINNVANGSVMPTTFVDHDDATIEEVFTKYGSVWTAWRYAYNKSFLRKYALYFTKDILAEDLDFNATLFALPDVKTKCVHIPYYIYAHHRSGSIMESTSIKLLEDVSNTMRKHTAKLKSRKDQMAKLIRRKILMEYLLLVPRIYQFDKADRKRIHYLYRAKGTPLLINPTIFAPFMHIVRKVYHKIK